MWVSDQRAQAERERLEQLRQQHFAGPLVAPEATQNAPEFYVLAIADNLFLTQEQSVPGITLTPMTSALGDDIRVVLNGLLLQRGFRQSLMQEKWIEHMRRDRPAVLIECRVKAETAETAGTFGGEQIKRMLDLMTLRRGASARLIGGVVGQQTDSGHYEARGIWIEHSGYTGNLVGGIISGEDIHGLQDSWNDLQANHEPNYGPLYTPMPCATPAGITSFSDASTSSEAIADTVVVPNTPIHRCSRQPTATAQRKGVLHHLEATRQDVRPPDAPSCHDPAEPCLLHNPATKHKCRRRGPVMG